ncbi:transketolase [Bacillus salipaludis]|uniref:transketolase n=1 Tax=Bacillus salipaludis TaxID=2547811 RepID=UPI002E250A72|nr:transketolase [Bacillus salipaludis]
MNSPIQQLAINTIRTLAIDSVERAQSGHPGMPMGAAPMAFTLWTKFLKQNPEHPKWFNRDRFILSSGHGSMLLYSLLHLSGFDLTLEDLKNFRQFGSRTPGHPEYNHTPGVEATTGPLGQGVGMAVGMAMAERHLSAVYNRAGYPIVDHFSYCICGDGDLMEGVSGEVASLAGHLKLGRLIVMYDSNGTSLDGETGLSFTENVGGRFEAYGWQVLHVENGNNVGAIESALEAARLETERPTLIQVRTIIGYGAPNKAGKSVAHGAPLGRDEASAAKAFYHLVSTEEFHVPDKVYEYFQTIKERGKQKEREWIQLFQNYKEEYPTLATQFERIINGDLPEEWDSALPLYDAGGKMATRVASNQVLEALTQRLPEFFGGSADLASSTKGKINGGSDFRAGHYEGRNVHFGVREFAMAATANGMALHFGVRPFVSTYFVFSDYLRPALRLSALMGVPVTYVFTHDSLAVGEDGPTHQPVEQLVSLRAIPRVSVIRPADANETVYAWKAAVEERERPTVLVLSRQDLPILEGTARLGKNGVEKGAYVLSEAKGEAKALLMGSGSEVQLMLGAQKVLAEQGIGVSVISFPSWELFEKQSQDYKNQVLPDSIDVRLAVEMGSSLGWHKYVGRNGKVIGVDNFGASGKGGQLVEMRGFTVENIVSQLLELLGDGPKIG